jgi:hypothetical protein
MNKIAMFLKIFLIMSGIVNDKHYSDENKKRIAHNLEDILIDCKFNYQKCSASDFVWHFDPLFGNCYVFNSGYNSTGDAIELKQSSVAGVLFGLQVKLYLNYNENLRLLSAYQGGIGAMVRIDNSSYMTDHIFDGIRIMAGTHTELEIERSFKFTMPKPYSSCEIDDSSPMTSNSELYNLIAQSQFEYTQQLCFQLMLSKIFY